MKTYLERQAENQELVENYINELDVLYDDANYYLDAIDEDTKIEDIDEMLWNHQAFEKEVIYYDDAMKILSKEDCSLIESMEIAENLGYQVKDLTSTLLASLIKTRRNEEAWDEVRSEVADFLEDLDWSYDEDEE